MILAAKRTPVLKSLSKGITISDLFRATLLATLGKIPLTPAGVEIVMGCGLSLKEVNFESSNIRLICGYNSGLESIIQQHKNNLVLCGGFDFPSKESFTDQLTSNERVASIIENLAAKYEITQDNLDELRIKSYEKAKKAKKTRILKREILEVNNIKHDEKLMSQMSEFGCNTYGLQGLLLASKEYVIDNKVQPRAEVITSYEIKSSSIEFPLLTIQAIDNCIQRARLRIEDIDYFEIDETFGITPILLNRIKGIDIRRINMHGGTLALCDPIGYLILTL